MKKIGNSSVSLPQILILLGILGIASYFIFKWVQKIQHDKDVTVTTKLSKNDALTQSNSSAGFKNIITSLQGGDIQQAATNAQQISDSLQNFPSDDIALQIHAAKGIFSDDIDSVYAAFGEITTQAQLAAVSDVFAVTFGTSLYPYLNTFMNADQLAQVYKIVGNLPNV